MHIALDGYTFTGSYDGFNEYTRHLGSALARLGHHVELVVPHDAEVGSIPAELTVEVTDFVAARAGAPRGAWSMDWYDTALPAHLRLRRPDVFVGTSFFLPRAWGGPMAVTVHDVIFLTHPQFFSDSSRQFYTQRGHDAVRRADGILAVSSSTANQLETFWGPTTVPLAVTGLASVHDAAMPPREQAADVIARELGLGRDYVLNVSSTHRRKNIAAAIDAYLGLPDDLRRAHPLVLANADHERVHALLSARSASDVVVTGRVPAELMGALYAGAAVLVHPTFAEGFGLPVLDAMRAGTPVVAADRPAIPEVAGGAALLVDPDDVPSITNALRTVLTDRILADRLRSAGRSRAGEFSWVDVGNRTAALLEKIAS